MGKPKRERTLEEVIQRAGRMDARRQRQIANQIATINRLTAAVLARTPWSYDDEMGKLHKELSEAQAERDELRTERDQLRTRLEEM